MAWAEISLLRKRCRCRAGRCRRARCAAAAASNSRWV